MSPWWRLLIYLVAAPLIGGLLAGIDRRISARMQARRGPPLLQPFYDVAKLWSKERLVVRRSQSFYIIFFFVLTVFTGALFFCGSDLLLVFFALTLSGIFFVRGAFKASSPYSFVGASRELIQMMAYEPIVLLTACGLYMVTHTFSIDRIAAGAHMPIILLPGVFIALMYAMEMKFRKSPFDLSASHHAHQELVRGITTEFSGPTLALIEVAHWYENVMLLGWLFLFFSMHWTLGLVACAVCFFMLLVVDNVCARVKWVFALRSAWIMTLVLGCGNILVLWLLQVFGLLKLS
jgi:formate hydrogenlyase subunit 4